MADRIHEVVADEIHQAAQASSRGLSADAKQDVSHLAVDLVLHMVPMDGDSLAGQLADDRSDHEMLNSQADSVDEDRLETVQAQRYYLADCKQDPQRSQSLLRLEAEEGMADVRSMAADYLSACHV